MLKASHIIIALLVLLATYAFAVNKGPEIIKIDGGSRGNIELPHHLHQDNLQSCTQCHDLFPQESGGIKKMQDESKLKKKEVMNACIACHKTKKKEGEKHGPTSCNDCHKK